MISCEIEFRGIYIKKGTEFTEKSLQNGFRKVLSPLE